MTGIASPDFAVFFIILESFKEIVSRDFDVLFLFIWIDMMFLIVPDQVYFSF
jgi:hypothetical protein